MSTGLDRGLFARAAHSASGTVSQRLREDHQPYPWRRLGYGQCFRYPFGRFDLGNAGKENKTPPGGNREITPVVSSVEPQGFIREFPLSQAASCSAATG